MTRRQMGVVMLSLGGVLVLLAAFGRSWWESAGGPAGLLGFYGGRESYASYSIMSKPPAPDAVLVFGHLAFAGCLMVVTTVSVSLGRLAMRRSPVHSIVLRTGLATTAGSALIFTAAGLDAWDRGAFVGSSFYVLVAGTAVTFVADLLLRQVGFTAPANAAEPAATTIP